MNYTMNKNTEIIVQGLDTIVLGNFRGFSSQFYVFSAALTILVDAIVMFMLLAKKIPRNGFKMDQVMLFSLALCDLLYEATTTVFILRTNTCEVGEDCKTLYFVYLALNLCTTFHIIVQVMGKIVHRINDSSLFWSGCAWLSAFTIASADVYSGIGLMGLPSMTLLDSFKAFGHVLFDAIFLSGVFVVLCTICTTSRLDFNQDSLFEKHQQESFAAKANSRLATSNDVLMSSICLACLVGWCTWVAITIYHHTRIMVVIEVMKCFELIRLGARFLNLLTIMCAFAQNGGHIVVY